MHVNQQIRSVLVVLDLVAQVLLIVVGVLLYASQDDAQILALMTWWCLLATTYWIATMVVVATSVRRAASAVELTRLEQTRTARAIGITATFLNSLVGLGSALTLLLMRNDATWGESYRFVGVWTMVVAWALFHWGYARIYEVRYRTSDPKPLEFPGGNEPQLSDFVYFSFTNATAFSTPDIPVLTSRMRWTVVWHGTLGFFFNALILVLAVNTIISG